MLVVTKWDVVVSGDASDLEYLASHCKSPPLIVTKRGDGSYRLYHSDFDAFDTSNSLALFETAHRVAITLSGALQQVSGSSSTLEVGGACAIGPDGVLHRFLQLDPASFNLKTGWVSAAVGTSDGSSPPTPQQPKAIRLFNMAQTDAAVAKVMGLIANGDKSTWVGLYRIHEVVVGDVGGQKALIKLGRVTEKQLKRFTHSSDSVAVAGDQARHGKETTQPPKNPMSLNEATAFVTDLLDSWFSSKGIS